MRVLCAALIVAACGAPAPASVTASDPAPAWRVRPSGGMHAIDPGPASADLLDARGCASCHAAIVDEWSTSRHALAWTNGIFQREYSVRPQAWCVNCHAPLTTQQRDLDGVAAAQGVDCATCHVRRGTLVSARRGAKSPHATIEDPSFGTPAFCADCHQFTFPVFDKRGAATRMTEHPMQNTVATFLSGPYANEREGCLTCHGSRHGHAFAGAHDRGMLEAALEVSWCRPTDLALRVAIKNSGAGHTVPTGDIHRHMYARLWRSSAPEALYQAFFGRRFEPAPDGGKTTVWDSSIAPGQTKLLEIPVAQLAGDDDEPVNLELVYVYLANEFPRPSNAPDEPTSMSIVRRASATREIPVCAP
ncbi:MAG TPA: multiheme c-type cytochrome [Kofleriaceae bacterium]